MSCIYLRQQNYRPNSFLVTSIPITGDVKQNTFYFVIQKVKTLFPKKNVNPTLRSPRCISLNRGQPNR